MHVQLLGTGSADRWPNPWCACPGCAGARARGIHRARTSALVDGSLLIDPGPDAGGGGVDLSGVRTVLITHDHPDHLDPAFLLAWAWAGSTPLVVAGPAGAVDRCRDWVGPDAPVTFVALAAGDTLATDDPVGEVPGRSAGHLVRALPAAHSTVAGRAHDGTALLYDVVGDGRLLYATDTAALPHRDLDGRYDLVLLELTFGDTYDHATAHLDLASFGHELAMLRAADRLADGARVVAVHLSHHNPADLGRRLAGIGAEVVPDGTTLQVGGGRRGRRLLVTGGARSGKSARAEHLVAHRPSVTYLATAPAFDDDPEWVARVAAHRARRPSTWRTVETLEVAAALAGARAGETLLVDCLALWVTGLVDRAEAWERRTTAEDVLAAALAELVAGLAATPADIVLVTNEVGSGVVPGTPAGRLFQDLLGRVNVAVAGTCDDVELITCGLPLTLKGTPWTALS